MNNSYKLFGTFWDNRPIPENCPQVIAYDEKGSFDVTIELSDMFGEKQPVADHMKQDGSVALLIDYFPGTTKNAVWDFYVTRMLQVVEYCGVSVIVCQEKDEANLIGEALIDYYKH